MNSLSIVFQEYEQLFLLVVLNETSLLTFIRKYMT